MEAYRKFNTFTAMFIKEQSLNEEETSHQVHEVDDIQDMSVL